ncbi:MAG: hypothetical protein IJW83_05635, partial [Clostridia bacterium]|nr:hypothetical protein [Clostridia bacterium]
SFEDGVLVFDSEGANVYFMLNDESMTATYYQPEGDIIGTYYYAPYEGFLVTLTVYGTYNGEGLYATLMTQSYTSEDGATESVTLTTDVTLNLEAMTLSHIMFGPGKMSIDETNTIYCNHEYVTEEKEATCTEGGYKRQECINCGRGQGSYTEPLGHDYGEDGTCTRCGEIGGGIVDEELENHRNQVYNEVKMMFYDLGETYDISAYEKEFENILDNIMQAKSFEEIEACHEKYHALHERILNGAADTCLHEKTNATCIEEPTCTATGTMLIYCEACGSQWKEPLPKTDHTIDENGVCSICGFDTSNVAYTYEQTVLDDAGNLMYLVSYVFYKNGTCIIAISSGEEQPLYWANVDGYICMYMDEAHTQMVGRMIVNEDGTLTPFVCTEHDYVVVEHQEATCTQGEFTRYQCTICGAGYGMGTGPLGHDYGEDGICTRCGEIGGGITDEELENYRNQVYNEVKMTFYDLGEKYDVSAYEKELDNILNNIMQAKSFEEIDRHVDMFNDLRDRIINNAPQACNHFFNDMGYCEYCGERDPNFVYDYLQDAYIDAELSFYLGVDVETVIQALVGKELGLSFSVSGTHYLPITEDMIDVSRLTLDEIGTTYLNVSYSYTSETTNVSGSVSVPVHITPDMTDAKAYGPYVFDESFADMTGWTDITVYDNGYFAIDGEFMTYTSFEDGVLVFDS